ncbi:hypothetical protein LEP1GSC058_1446 [Leptospira fainei serovar Hurstbridge str. BUT 6]|uniref:Uncharacterized protein n=1 Tax=Leptospira fainei serovar Hurstbridge str. BUT 6 TaxID=1193011 RepID=S3VIX3_9LEPT|nr:hypothetical protein LEP1GSC058_1446 [Leptospira fainei serovar Hurstbridge str. BUT 6]
MRSNYICLIILLTTTEKRKKNNRQYVDFVTFGTGFLYPNR